MVFSADPFSMKARPGFANLRLQFPQDSGFENYGTYRFDTFHQLTYPNTYFWVAFDRATGGGIAEPIMARRLTWDRQRLYRHQIRSYPILFFPPPTMANPVKVRRRHISLGFSIQAPKLHSRSHVHGEERAKPRGRTGRTHACYSTVHGLFLCERGWT